MSDDIQKRLADSKKAAAIAEFQTEKQKAHSVVGKIFYEANWFRKFATQFIGAVFWIWNYIFNPIWSFVAWPFTKFFWKQYRTWWTNFVMREDKYGVIRTSKMRAVTMVLMTIVGFYATINIAMLTWDSSVYMATKRVDERIFLFKSEDSFQKHGTFSVSGCEINSKFLQDESIDKITLDDFSCKDTKDSLYFRIENSWFNTLWKVTNEGSFFWPDLVASSIATNWNVCKATTYGFRWRFFIGLGWVDLYPYLLSTECKAAK